jgi:hypothetical protein
MPKAKSPRNNDVSQSRVIPMPDAISTPVRKSATGSNLTPTDLESQIRIRAYELYQERGCTPGQENDDWFRAEHEVLGRQRHHQSA